MSSLTSSSLSSASDLIVVGDDGVRYESYPTSEKLLGDFLLSATSDDSLDATMRSILMSEKNNTVKDAITTSIINEKLKSINFECAGKVTVRLAQSLSAEDLTDIRRNFSCFNIETTDVDGGPHALARAIRTVSFYFLRYQFFRSLDMFNTMLPDGKYHVVQKDVGANPIQFIKSAFYSVHSCCPVINTADIFRKNN